MGKLRRNDARRCNRRRVGTARLSQRGRRSCRQKCSGGNKRIAARGEHVNSREVHEGRRHGDVRMVAGIFSPIGQTRPNPGATINSLLISSKQRATEGQVRQASISASSLRSAGTSSFSNTSI